MRITGRKGESYESLCKKVTDAETAQDYLKLSDKVLPFITGIKQGIEYGFGDNGDGGGLTADPAIDLPMVVYATDLEILKTQFLTRDWSKSLPNHYIFDCLVVVELSRPRIREELAVEYGSLYRSLPASGEKTTL
jgi:hypothetical protein